MVYASYPWVIILVVSFFSNLLRFSLGVDGGGIRGLSALIILRKILEKYQDLHNPTELPRPHEVFDMAGGTSTGGFVYNTQVSMKAMLIIAHTQVDRPYAVSPQDDY